MLLLKKFLSEELSIQSGEIYNQFEQYNKLLLEWNSKVNLISRKKESIESNVLNSIFFLTKFDLSKYKKIIDIGTGGGFPGLPLSIIYPDIRFTLLDSIRKKVNAVTDICSNLKLKNVHTICGRAEEISKLKNHHHQYDLVLSKSVSTLSNLFNWGKDYIDKNGVIICIKGGELKNELEGLLSEKQISVEVINFVFNDEYKIEDKKIVLIKKLNLLH